MNDRVMQFRVGVVVLATAIIGGLLVTLNSPAPKEWVPWGRGTYRVTVELQQAPGIGPNTPVRKNGLLIGRVASIDDLDDHIAVHINVDAGSHLFPQYECQVRTSVLGDATIEFVARPVPPGTPPLPDGAIVKGVVVGNPLDMVANLQGDLQVTIASLGRAGDEVANLSMRVNRAFGDEQDKGKVTRLMDKTEQAMEDFYQAAKRVNDFFGNRDLQDTIHEGRATMGDVRTSLQDLRSSLQGVREMASSASRNLKNLEGFTEPLGRNGEQVANSLIGALEGLGRIVEELTVLTESLNNREGTIGQLVHNPEVYQNLNKLLCNANSVVLRVNDLTLRLRPILDDARVFSDKIAREPGRIVGGALSTGPGIK